MRDVILQPSSSSVPGHRRQTRTSTSDLHWLGMALDLSTASDVRRSAGLRDVRATAPVIAVSALYALVVFGMLSANPSSLIPAGVVSLVCGLALRRWSAMLLAPLTFIGVALLSGPPVGGDRAEVALLAGLAAGTALGRLSRRVAFLRRRSSRRRHQTRSPRLN